LLTSITTFMGLLPIQLEASIQAQFVKPMAISIAFGVLFATAVTLFLVPVLYYVGRDIRQLLGGGVGAGGEPDGRTAPGQDRAGVTS
jgi:predicted RND superfamily exporter protein